MYFIYVLFTLLIYLKSIRKIKNKNNFFYHLLLKKTSNLKQSTDVENVFVERTVLNLQP